MTEPNQPTPAQPDDQQGASEAAAEHNAGVGTPRPAPPRYGLRSSDLGITPPPAPEQSAQQAPQPWAQQPGHGHYQGQHQGYGQQPGPYQQGHGQYPQGYGQQSGPGGPWQGPPAQKPARPKRVDQAFWLIIAAAVTGLIASTVSFMRLGSAGIRNELERALLEAGENFSAAQLDSVMSLFWFALGLSFIITTALYLLVAFNVRAGRHWARVLGAVFAGISLVFLVGPDPLNAVSIVLGIAAIVLLFLPDSNAYFEASKRYRRLRQLEKFR